MAGWKETIGGLYLKVARLEERFKAAEKEIKALKAAKAVGDNAPNKLRGE